MDKSSAFKAGVVGGLVMTLALLLMRLINLTDLNTEMMLGSQLSRELSPGSWWLGLIEHLVVSGLIGIAYAAAFHGFGQCPTAANGAAFGAIHGFIGGCAMLFMPLMHPLIPGPLLAPGFMALNYGILTALGFFMVHILYGAVVGASYEREFVT